MDRHPLGSSTSEAPPWSPPTTASDASLLNSAGQITARLFFALILPQFYLYNSNSAPAYRMVPMHRLILPIFALFFALAQPALSADDQKVQPPKDNPEQMIEEGVNAVLNALKKLLRSIPQYAVPEILDNGDIIIRRIHPENKPRQQSPQNRGRDQTDT